MATSVTFRPFLSTDKRACLALFDANCPEFVAPNERADYARFLDANRLGYELCLVGGQIVGAFGLMGSDLQHKSPNWILLDPRTHGMGIGSAVMSRISTSGRRSGAGLVTIAASHKSAPFFARFGAVAVAVIDNGWGQGMHRVDMELRL